jgi:hypothetical protein
MPGRSEVEYQLAGKLQRKFRLRCAQLLFRPRPTERSSRTNSFSEEMLC